MRTKGKAKPSPHIVSSISSRPVHPSGQYIQGHSNEPIDNLASEDHLEQLPLSKRIKLSSASSSHSTTCASYNPCTVNKPQYDSNIAQSSTIDNNDSVCYAFTPDVMMGGVMHGPLTHSPDKVSFRLHLPHRNAAKLYCLKNLDSALLTYSSCRCRVPVELRGGNESLPIVLTSPDVEKLTGITGQQLRDSHEFDLNVEDDLQMSLDKLEVVCFVKKYDQSTLGSPGRHGIRYAVAKTYPATVLEPSTAIKPSSSSTADLSATDKDKQFFTPTINKQLAEIEATTECRKSEQQSPSAKRPLDFTSLPPEVDKIDAAMSSSKEHVGPPFIEEASNVDKSPVKKGRDKLKLN